MQIKKFGISLESLSLSDLELVRNWRNSDQVRPFMHYQEVISSEMQRLWFNGMDPLRNLYFIISKDQIKTGLIHLKDIDWSSNIAEAGIFIGGMDGIEVEFNLFRKLQPQAILLPIASTGAASKIVYEEYLPEDFKNEKLTNDYGYMSLFQELLIDKLK